MWWTWVAIFLACFLEASPSSEFLEASSIWSLLTWESVSTVKGHSLVAWWWSSVVAPIAWCIRCNILCGHVDHIVVDVIASLFLFFLLLEIGTLLLLLNVDMSMAFCWCSHNKHIYDVEKKLKFCCCCCSKQYRYYFPWSPPHFELMIRPWMGNIICLNKCKSVFNILPLDYSKIIIISGYSIGEGKFRNMTIFHVCRQ